MIERLRERLLEMGPIRRRVGRPPWQEVARSLETQVPRVRRFAMDNVIAQDRGNLRRSLDSLKTHVELPPEGPAPAEAAALTAWWLFATLPDQFAQKAQEALANGDMPLFRLSYDLAVGINSVLCDVINAHGRLEEDRSPESRSVNSLFEGIRGNAENASIIDIAVESEKMRNRRAVEFLKEDPTGFSMVDDFVTQVKTNSQFAEPSWAKGYVVAGAELARDMYKAVYEIAGELYPQ